MISNGYYWLYYVLCSIPCSCKKLLAELLTVGTMAVWPAWARLHWKAWQIGPPAPRRVLPGRHVRRLGRKLGVRRGAAGCQDRRRPGPACRKLQGAWVHVAMCSGAGARRNGLAGAIRRRGDPASADDTRLRRTYSSEEVRRAVEQQRTSPCGRPAMLHASYSTDAMLQMLQVGRAIASFPTNKVTAASRTGLIARCSLTFLLTLPLPREIKQKRKKSPPKL